MTAADQIALLEEWKTAHLEMGRVHGLLDAATGCFPESPLRNATGRLTDAYTRAVAKLIGDDDGWLDWYAYECDFGANPRKATFSDGEPLLVVGVTDLLDLIHTHPDGTRNPHWSTDP